MIEVKPNIIQTDNGPEFTSKDLVHWARDNEIQIQFIQPGISMQNGYIERFNRIYRESILDAYLFFELDQVKTLTEEWMEEFNLRRPHESLGNLTPSEWKMKQLKIELSTFKL